MLIDNGKLTWYASRLRMHAPIHVNLKCFKRTLSPTCSVIRKKHIVNLKGLKLDLREYHDIDKWAPTRENLSSGLPPCQTQTKHSQ